MKAKIVKKQIQEIKEKGYKEGLTREEYKNLLERGYERLISREKEKEAEQLYNNRCQMIERIKSSSYHKDFNYREPPKIMYLKNEK